MAAEIVGDIAYINWERGGPCLTPACKLQRCAVCEHHTELTWWADSETHRIANRSGHSTERALCAHCWGRLLKRDQ